MKPAVVLGSLVATSIAVSGWIYGLHWRGAAAGGSAPVEDEATARQMAQLEDEIAALHRENKVLRSLAQGGGDFPISADQQAFVEDQLGLSFRSSPKVKKASQEALRDAVLGELTHQYGESGLQERSHIWGLLGLIPMEQNLRGQLHAVGVERIRGTLSAEGALIPADFDPEHVRDASALVRLLAQLLIDQYLTIPAGASDDSRWALLAVRDGLAGKVVAAFQARQARLLGTMGSAADVGAAELLTSLPAFVQELVLFSPRHGLAYLDARKESTREILNNPPLSTADFFQPGEKQRPGDLGQLGVYGLLLQTMEAPDAAKLSDNWRSDRVIYENDRITWKISTQSEESAKTIAAAAKDVLGASFPFEAQKEIPLYLRRRWNVTVSGGKVTILNEPMKAETE